MKKRFFFIIVFLILILMYVTNISQIPDRIVLLEGEEVNIKTLFGIELKSNPKDIIETWQQGNIENQKFQVSLLGNLNVKEISVTTLPAVKVVPLGKLIRTKIIYKWCISDRNGRDNKYKQ